MIAVLLSLLLTLRESARSRAALQIEVLALRHQLHVLQRTRPRRLRLTKADRWLWVVLSRIWTEWRTALVMVQPETVIAWHRQGFRLFWRWKSRRRVGRPTVPHEIRTLIRTTSNANPLWGAPRIHGEVPKLGIEVGQASVAKYMTRQRQPPSQTWRAFLRNHLGQIVAADFFVVLTATYRLLYVLVLLAHDRRRIVHVAVTDHPAAAWTAQQLRDAFPWDQAPRFLLHDRDHAFDGLPATAIGMHDVRTASRSPWQNTYVERFIGSVRRECLDHVIVVNPAGLRRILNAYVEYYTTARTHLALEKDAPLPRPVASPTAGRVVATPGRRAPPSRPERWDLARRLRDLAGRSLSDQLEVLQRTRPRRVRLAKTDRWLWVVLSWLWTGWRTALVIVKPETVIAWHRRGFRLWWTWKSLRRLGRPTVPADVRTLIRTMAEANPRWGAPRMHGELLKLGINVCQATGAKYMGPRRPPPSQTWRTFLRNHIGQIVAADFFVVPTVTYRLLFVLVLLAHDRRRIRHVAVTAHPTAVWTAQQLREAFPWNEAPRSVIHDRDHAFYGLGATAQAMGIEDVLTAPRAPWQNPFVERFIGSARRECLDHVIVFNEAGLRRLMALYGSYYERSRTHLSLDKDTPIPRPIMPPGDGPIVEIPEVGGLHHRYERRAA